MKDKTDWRQKAHDHLSAGQFSKGFCHMKLPNPKYTGDWDFGDIHKDPKPVEPRYLGFGIVFPTDVCKICYVDTDGNVTGETITFKSIDEMLDAGWDVD